MQRPQGVPKLLRVPPALSHCLRNHCAERFYNFFRIALVGRTGRTGQEEKSLCCEKNVLDALI